MDNGPIKKKKPKVIGLHQLAHKKFDFLDGLPVEIKRSFGDLVRGFQMLVWGKGKNGKSNFIYQFIRALMKYGVVLYIALEEGTEATTQITSLRHLNVEAHGRKILFADHTMPYDELVRYLKRKKSPQFVVVDSLQYWDVNYVKYKALKELFPRKGFIWISHASGKRPKGSTADAISYDVGIVAHVEGYIASVQSRYGGNAPYVVWEEGAKAFWGKKYKKASCVNQSL